MTAITQLTLPVKEIFLGSVRVS